MCDHHTETAFFSVITTRSPYEALLPVSNGISDNDRCDTYCSNYRYDVRVCVENNSFFRSGATRLRRGGLESEASDDSFPSPGDTGKVSYGWSVTCHRQRRR